MNEDQCYNLYKMCIDEACKTGERRMKNNQFFILLNSALVSFISSIYMGDTTLRTVLAIVFLSTTGLTLCFFWKESIAAYKQLNTAKFKVILEIEKKLQFQCFQAEWNMLSMPEGNYIALSSHEAKIPKLFLGVYWVSLLIHMVWALDIVFQHCS